MPPRLRFRPNWHTLALLCMLAAMWYAAEAQSNGAAYLLALLTGVLALVSLLHARANVKGLRLRVRSVTTVPKSSRARVRVEVFNISAKDACGIEIQVLEGSGSQFIESIASGQSRCIELPLINKTGRGSSFKLVARSVYPLGLYKIEGVVETAAPRYVHPSPKGSLPLPCPKPLSPHSQAGASSPSTISGGGGGCDFAGTREFQPGDSPRHIDWRAVARGRPLAVKTWASNGHEATMIDWESIQVDEAVRAAQIARWIEDCERDEKLYALRLPSQSIEAGRGYSHRRRCLHALADFTASQVGTVTGKGAEKLRESRGGTRSAFESSFHLPTQPLLALSLAMAASFLPLANVIQAPALIVALCCLGWRVLLRRGVPPVILRVFILLGSVALIWSGHGGQPSMEAGIALLAALSGVKLLESRTPREFQVLALIGWFLCLCGIVIDNSLPRMLWGLAVFALITACMTRFRLSTPGLWRPLRVTSLLFAQSFPIVIVLFLIMPRGLLDLRTTFSGRFAESGISNELDPGSITKVALRMERAFRASFPDGRIPPNELRYWRCLTLNECNGLRWRRGERLELKLRPKPLDENIDVRQELQIEPHGMRWIPALDVPLLVTTGGSPSIPEFDDALSSPIPIRGVTRVSTWSRLQQRSFEPLPEHHRQIFLEFPENLPQVVFDLADEWQARAENDMQIVQLGVLHLQQNGYQYTLTPDDYLGTTGLEDFLVRGKSGFCEHFASSFATLMRVAGVPARVVIGFLGGEYNDRSRQMIVRQSDAHAWVEVWLEKSGWTRVDPTAALAPGRIGHGNFRGYLDLDGAAIERQRLSWWGIALFESRLLWDQANYAWQDAVVEFNEDFQHEWLSRLGFENSRWWHLLTFSILFVLLGLALISLLLQRRPFGGDPWHHAWLKLCAKLAKAGHSARHPAEGPLAYAQRVAPVCSPLHDLALLYAEGRYGAFGASLPAFQKKAAGFEMPFK
ncbi:MAG: transglutaminaseTgpA domain-containing protein [Prosthecobacter sp.]